VTAGTRWALALGALLLAVAIGLFAGNRSPIGPGASSGLRPAGVDDAPPGARPGPASGARIAGPVAGLYSERYPWLADADVAPELMLYFQAGTDGGHRTYRGTADDPGDGNPWFDARRRGDTVHGDFAIWFRRPELGADAPDLDARNASSRQLWKALDARWDVRSFRYANLWVKPLDGFEGYLGLSLGSWDPAEGGVSPDDGVRVVRRFPQRVEGDDWQGLSIPLASFEGVDFERFARYEIEFPGEADGHAFLFDELTLSLERPPGAGAPSPRVYALTEPGEDPRTARDLLRIAVDRPRTFQTVRGFGFFGDSLAKARLITDLGASIVRIELPARDPIREVRPNTEMISGWEPENDDDDDRSFLRTLDGFNRAETEATVEFLEAYRALDPEIAFVACPWSPPGWMKVGGRVSGASGRDPRENRIRPDRFGEYGEFLASFAVHLHREGVALAGLGMGNEVHFDHAFPSMNLVGDDMARALRATQERLTAAEEQVAGFVAPRLMADDHVLNEVFLTTGFLPLLERLGADPALADAVDILSYHSYGVEAQRPEAVPQTVLHRLKRATYRHLGPDAELWMTETSGFHNGRLDSGSRKGALTMAEGILTSLVYGNASAWIYFTPGELLHYGTLSWPGHALRHFARFVRPGAKRFFAEVSGQRDRVLIAAFENPPEASAGRSIAVVLVNVDDEAHGLDLTALPRVAGYDGYREVRSSRHHAGAALGRIEPETTGSEPYVLPPQSIVTLFQGPPPPAPPPPPPR